MTRDAKWSGSMPETYDRCLGPALFAPYAEHLAGIARELDPGRVLELAAGTGILTSALVGALPDARITATDLNPAMVEWAAPRAPAAQWLVADAQHLDLPDESFDLVACQFGVMFFPDRPQAFAEVARVLRPGGTFVFATWDGVETSDIPAALVRSLTEVLSDDSPTFVVRIPHGYHDRDRIEGDLGAGGLDVETVDRVVLRGRATSADVAAEGFCHGTPLRFELERHGDLQEITRAVGATMTGHLGAGPIEAELAAYVVTAHKPE